MGQQDAALYQAQIQAPQQAGQLFRGPFLSPGPLPGLGVNPGPGLLGAAPLMDANREALFAAACQLQTGDSLSSEEEDDDDDGQGQIDAFLRSVANIHAQGAASSVSYFV